MPLIFLTEQDRDIIQQFLDAHRQDRVNPPNRSRTESSWSEGEDHQAPETYIVLPPDGGIPALSEGTGPDGTDVPGTADCDVYTELGHLTTTPRLVKMPGFTLNVHNLTTKVIESSFLLVSRTKYGIWVAHVAAGACNKIRFKIISVDSTGPITFATADILSRSCGCETVPEETGTGTAETVDVYDATECFFDEPDEDLVDRIGYADYMIDETLEGTGTTQDDCRWEVTMLCCPVGTTGS